MNIKNHVTSPSISKKLKEIGILQKSFFMHWYLKDKYMGANWQGMFEVGEYTDRIAAFTLSELMGMGIPSDKTNVDLLALDLIYSLQNQLIKLSDVNLRIANG